MQIIHLNSLYSIQYNNMKETRRSCKSAKHHLPSHCTPFLSLFLICRLKVLVFLDVTIGHSQGQLRRSSCNHSPVKIPSVSLSVLPIPNLLTLFFKADRQIFPHLSWLTRPTTGVHSCQMSGQSEGNTTRSSPSESRRFIHRH